MTSGSAAERGKVNIPPMMPPFSAFSSVACVCVCMCVCVHVCVCVCVYVCVLCVWVCVMERLLPQFQAWLIGTWCSVYTCTFANVQMYIHCIKIVWVCCRYPSQLQTLQVIEFMLSGLSLLCCIRIEGIKGEDTVISKAACFHLSQLRTSTSAGRVWLRSGVRPLPNSTLTLRWA